MADQMDNELRERLKAALWFSIGKIVDEETMRLNTNATPQFIGALSEMVWTQIGPVDYAENVAIDLEAFARHAGRTTVNTDDVLLVTRRNDALHGIMRDFVEKEGARKARTKAKGKGKEKEKARK
ncbi:hypothetical protein PVAG01_06783 [Phlyctema vagabunda]|uniref:Apoptosis-inducing TAF9-like domain 1 family protein n=1 Tax=Phlyctema vagabunda TaxID=108571 RepID=A0ABR4PH28_9HELO